MIRRILLENYSLKAASLVLALLLWGFVTSKGQTELALDVPIEYVSIPSDIEIARHTTKSAHIVIRGHESVLKNVRQGEVRATVDVGKAREGEGIFPLRKDDIVMPRAVTVTKIDPPSVRLVFEKTVLKNVRVRPVIVGNPETGYAVTSVEVRPAEVVIEGAQSEVSRIGTVKTESIDITGLAEDFAQEVELALADRPVRAKTDKVSVTIKITRRGT